MQQRFPSSDFLVAATSLDPSSWPRNPLDQAFFGEKHVATLCKLFGLGCVKAANTVLEYAMLKKNDGVTLGPKLKYLISALKVLPIASADCERGFSQMNLYHTSRRKRLLKTAVCDLFTTGINGPPLTDLISG